MKYRGITICWLLAGILLLGAAGVWRERLSQPRAPIREFVPPPADMPPAMIFTTVALGGLRGIIADLLWMRLIHLQETGAPLEIVQLSRWITALEPHFARVWAFHAWNLSYNISVMFSEPEDRWRWVRHGISMLRDRALVYNPEHPLLLRELGWIYQHKIGFALDSAHQYYKARLAEEMHDLFGGAGPDYDFLPEQPGLLERITGHRLQPRIMEELDREYGPFDWRLPATHALYWSYQGRDFPAELNGVRECRQMFVQCMAAAFRGGRLRFNRSSGLYLVTPAPELLEPALRAHEEALAMFDHQAFHFAYANFMAEAVVLLYSFNRPEQAQELYERLIEKYPNPAGYPALEEFVITGLLQGLPAVSREHVTGLVEDFLFQSWLWQAADDAERADGTARLADLLRLEYMRDRPADDPQGLPPLAVMREQALLRALAELPAALQAPLRRHVPVLPGDQ